LEQDITFFGQIVNANLFVQEHSVVLDYEPISVNASQALTEANKMGPCLEPWNETAEGWFVYVLILSFDQSFPTFQRLNQSISKYLQPFNCSPSVSTIQHPHYRILPN
jgi:hypothetical protein